MADIEITITEIPTKNDMLEAVDFLKDLALYVGVADGVLTAAGEDSNQRDSSESAGEPVTNADLLFIHTNGAKIRKRKTKRGTARKFYLFSKGSPITVIPPRPVIEPAIEHNRARLNRMLTKAIDLAFDGKYDESLQQLKLTGMKAQNICRRWFLDPANGWPPNAPSVIRAKMRKGSTNPRPLIDTGELRKSITYFVNNKGNREQ